MDMVDRLVGLILALVGVLEVTWLADETRRVPDDEDTVPNDEDTAFSLSLGYSLRVSHGNAGSAEALC